MTDGRVKVLDLLLFNGLFLSDLLKNLRSNFFGCVTKEDYYGRLAEVSLVLNFDSEESVFQPI